VLSVVNPMLSWVKSLVSSEEVVRDDSFSFGPIKQYDDTATHNTGHTNRTDLLGNGHSYDTPPHDDEEDDDDGHGYEFELLVQAYMRDNHYQSRHQAMANIVYGTINAGFVALPYACYEVGVPMYIFCVVLVATIAGYTTTMVIKLASDQSTQAEGRVSIPRTLEDLAEIAYGFGGYCVVAVLQILLSLTLGCLSLDVWGELSSSILTGRLQNANVTPASLNWFLTDRVGGVLSGSCIVLPLILRSSTVSSLKWTSYTTIICMAAAFVAVLAAFTALDDGTVVAHDDIAADQSIEQLLDIKSQWWVVCLIVTLCFSYNQKAFSVYSCLRRRSARRWSFAVKRANVVIVLIYVLFGVLGYMAHMSKLERFNFFLDFDGVGSVVFDVTRGIVALGLLFTFPMDTLVASTTARRLYRRISYYRMTYRKSLQGHAYEPSLATDDASAQSAVQGTVRMSPRDNAYTDSSASALPSPPSFAAGSGGGYVAQDTEQGGLSRQSSPTRSERSSWPRPTDSERSATTSIGSAQSCGHTGDGASSAGIHHERAMSRNSSITVGGGVDVANCSLGEDPSSKRSSFSGGAGANSNTRLWKDRADTMTSSGTDASMQSESLNSPDAKHNPSHYSSEAFAQNDVISGELRRGTSIGSMSTTDALNPQNRSLGTSTASTADNMGNSKYDEWHMWDKRHASVGDRGEHVHEDVITCCGFHFPAALPAMLLFWALSVGGSVGLQSGVVMAATVGGVSTSIMVFVLPSMLYFKLGLTSDFQAAPLFGSLIANRLYMTITQVLGLILFMGNVGFIVYWLTHPEVSFNNVVNK